MAKRKHKPTPYTHINISFYVVFLSVSCFVTIAAFPKSSFYFTNAIKQLFVKKTFFIKEHELNFKDISSISETWEYLENVFINSFHWELDDTSSVHHPLVEDDKKILLEIRRLGAVRLRLLRVTNASCVTYAAFQPYIKKCYGEYSSASEETRPFGDGVGTAWTYKRKFVFETPSYWGILATYGGGGYYVDLPFSKNDSIDILKDLKMKKWLDRSMRALFIDFTLYNANVNLFCIVKLIFERSPVGDILTSSSIQTVNFLKYVDSFDYLVFIFELFFVFFILYYTYKEFIEIQKNKLSYFMHFWNLLDFSLLLMSYVITAFNVYVYIYLKIYLKDLIPNQDKYVEFDELTFTEVMINKIVAVFVFLLWIKLFKYLSFNAALTHINMTLSKCANDVGSFIFMFFIILSSFAQAGKLLFGDQVRGFSTFPLTIFTLLRAFIGDFRMEEIETAHRIFGPLYLLAYVILVFFILLNMFLAILTETYTQVKRTNEPQNGEITILDLILFFPMIIRKYIILPLCRKPQNRTLQVDDDSQTVEMKPEFSANKMNSLEGTSTRHDYFERLENCLWETKVCIQKMEEILSEWREEAGRGLKSADEKQSLTEISSDQTII